MSLEPPTKSARIPLNHRVNKEAYELFEQGRKKDAVKRLEEGAYSSPLACFNVAKCYFHGEGVARDTAKAFDFCLEGFELMKTVDESSIMDLYNLTSLMKESHLVLSGLFFEIPCFLFMVFIGFSFKQIELFLKNILLPF